MLTYDELPDVLTPQHLIEYLPMGRNAIYEALKSHIIPSVRIGQKYLITKAALRDFLRGSNNVAVTGTPMRGHA